MKDELRALTAIDRLIHEPSRLAIMAVLYAAASADFLFLQRATGLTKGNLSVHLSRLEEAGYIEIEKTFVGKVTRTVCRMNGTGRKAFDAYRQQMKSIVDPE